MMFLQCLGLLEFWILYKPVFCLNGKNNMSKMSLYQLFYLNLRYTQLNLLRR